MKSKHSSDGSFDELSEKFNKINLQEKKSETKKSASTAVAKQSGNKVKFRGTKTDNQSKRQSEPDGETVDHRGPENGISTGYMQTQDHYQNTPFYQQPHGGTKRGNFTEYHDAAKFCLPNEVFPGEPYPAWNGNEFNPQAMYQTNYNSIWATSTGSQQMPNYPQRRESRSPSYDPNSPAGTSETQSLFSPGPDTNRYNSVGGLHHQSPTYDSNLSTNGMFPTYPTPPHQNQLSDVVPSDAVYYNGAHAYPFGVQSPETYGHNNCGYQSPTSYGSNPSPASSHNSITQYSGVPSPYDSSEQSLYGGNGPAYKDALPPDNIPSLPELGYNSIEAGKDGKYGFSWV